MMHDGIRESSRKDHPAEIITLMGDYQRKRSIVACDVCRRRRTKCDGERPKCGFCQAHEAHCAYQAVPEPPPSRLEVDIAGIRERLDHIIELLASDQRSSDTRSCPLPAAEARYESDDPDFPVIILQRRTMMLVLGLDQNTGAWLSNMERSTRLSSNQHQAGLSRMMLLLQPHGVSSTLQAFSERVHVWLPILTSDFYDSFSQCISGQYPTPSDTCLAMLVMALGSFAAVDSIMIALDQRPDAVFFAEAAASLPDVLLDFSVQSLQYLIPFTVYHMCLIRPCQAHDYVIMASARAQNMLKIYFYGANTKSIEVLRRAY
ncbi:hypothetical protein NW759_013322 [Fusarium solani]|nr:hypothetical protein NW759_013322 [Fusarium solani]